jgi:hypothetical protein
LLGEPGSSVPALEKFRIQEARRAFKGCDAQIDAVQEVVTKAGSAWMPSSSQMNGLEWIQCDTLLGCNYKGICAALAKEKGKSSQQAH